MQSLPEEVHCAETSCTSYKYCSWRDFGLHMHCMRQGFENKGVIGQTYEIAHGPADIPMSEMYENIQKPTQSSITFFDTSKMLDVVYGLAAVKV